MQNKKILLVDDEQAIREIIRDELEFDGFEVYEAANGRLAFDLTKTIAPDLIISDMIMPVMGGFELLLALRKLDRENPQIVLISGYSEVSRSSAIAAGASEMFNKPLNIEVISSYIKKILAA